MQVDARTLGELFYAASDELPDITWVEAFRILMEQLVVTATERFFLTEAELDALLEDIMSKLPEIFKHKAYKCA